MVSILSPSFLSNRSSSFSSSSCFTKDWPVRSFSTWSTFSSSEETLLSLSLRLLFVGVTIWGGGLEHDRQCHSAIPFGSFFSSVWFVFVIPWHFIWKWLEQRSHCRLGSSSLMQVWHEGQGGGGWDDSDSLRSVENAIVSLGRGFRM